MNVHVPKITLEDKYVSTQGRVYLNGIQALVRLALDQARLDHAAGLKTAGFISGYRGSPLGGFDSELLRNQKRLDALDLHFLPAVNEELGATAVWGSQKANAAGRKSRFDGVFGLWYGKAPGVDRAGDALRQANMAGTARHGGVLALAGDDHLAKSSILPAQSEFFFQHAEMPVFNPADIQDVLDYGLHGLAMSRYSGLWSALICLADTMDASAIVDISLDRLTFALPAGPSPQEEESLNRDLLLGNRLETERLLRELRLPAVRNYVRVNRLNRPAFGQRQRCRLGLVATGKAYRDLRQALNLIGIDEDRARELGLGLFKVGVPYPLEPEGLKEFANGCERLLVVEHKRAFLEPQVKDICFHLPQEARPQIWGKNRPDGGPFLSDVLELTIAELVQGLVDWLPEDVVTDEMRQVLATMTRQVMWAQGHAERAARIPFFCSGCPHSSSTRVPEGARAMPGIGCHAMAELAGRTSDGQIQMGGEGILWVGEHRFSNDTHAFANLGDGTYFHSGILAIRQAVADKAPITYKLLYNDAVAMTGGQSVDGVLSVPQITRQLEAEGVERIELVTDAPEAYQGMPGLAANVRISHRDELMHVQEALQKEAGVSVIVYEQTCATEKRRRRKRAKMAEAQSRLFINDRVCEGCGDCSVQSNCLSVEPVATPFGEKRSINQSSCNMDFSCLKGFCPSFVEVEGTGLRKADRAVIDIAALTEDLPEPARPDLGKPEPGKPELGKTWNMLVAGIGGMGVTTASAVLAMAAHLDGLQASTLDMTGLAQKGGPVTSHVRFASAQASIEGPRVPTASLDVMLAGDMVVSTNADQLALFNREKTLIAANTRVAPTAEFVLKQSLSFDETRMQTALREGGRELVSVDAAMLAEKLLGDAIFTNMVLVGEAYKAGGSTVSADAIEEALRLNRTAAEANIEAFRAGRIVVAAPEALADLLAPLTGEKEPSLNQKIAQFETELGLYQNKRYAKTYRDLVDAIRSQDVAHGPGTLRLTDTVATTLYKVMAYKDEYEVARLYSDQAFKDKLAAQFEDPSSIKIHLAPPLIARRVDRRTGRPQKMAFGPWIFGFFKLLAKGKRLRGSWADPFGYSAERRQERSLVQQYMKDLNLIDGQLETAPYGLLVELARLPQQIKGFGAVKEANLKQAYAKRALLLQQLGKGGDGSREDANVSQLLEAAE